MLGVCQFMKVLVGAVHPTVEPTLFDVELLHHLPVLFPLFTFPDFLKRVLVEVPNTERGIEKVRGTGKDPTICG